MVQCFSLFMNQVERYGLSMKKAKIRLRVIIKYKNAIIFPTVGAIKSIKVPFERSFRVLPKYRKKFSMLQMASIDI